MEERGNKLTSTATSWTEMKDILEDFLVLV
jgi:hypothetical protein